MKNHVSKWVLGTAAVAGVLGTLGMSAGTALARDNGVTIAETGSSLLYPLFNGQWVPAYKNVARNVQLTTASTGSGTGISQSIAGTVQIGASDAYLSDSQMRAHKTMVNIPLAISAQDIMYNVPGLKASQHLKLTGNVLANIYEGHIRYWNDPQITKINKGVKLPHKQIIPVYRSDGSGDTFLFTQFLSDTNNEWLNNTAYGTSVSWPQVQGEVGAKGNSGIVDTLASNPYSISYVGISYQDSATKQGIGYAALQNRKGNFVLPTTSNIQGAANAVAPSTPKDERISLIYAPGVNSYPIINFEYAIVNTHQSSPEMASAVRDFLTWSISATGGNQAKYLNAVRFLPLPAKLEALSKAQISKISN